MKNLVNKIKIPLLAVGMFLSTNTFSQNNKNDSLVNKNIFNISYFSRYNNSNILKNNIKNIDLNYNSDKPIALIIQNKNDSWHAFATQKHIQNIEKFNIGYKTFVYEAENDSLAFKYIKETAEKYGKISLLMIAGHGNQVSLNLGETYQGDLKTIEEINLYENFYIDISDTNKLKKYTKHLEEGAKIILSSCFTGEGGKETNNLANVIAKAFPGKIVYAPKEEFAVPYTSFIFDNKGKFEKVIFPDVYNYDKDITYSVLYQENKLLDMTNK